MTWARRLVVTALLGGLVLLIPIAASAEETATHGQVVSEVARCVPPGPEHGQIVPGVARSREAPDLDCSNNPAPSTEGSKGSAVSDDDPAVSGEESSATVDEGTSGSSSSKLIKTRKSSKSKAWWPKKDRGAVKASGGKSCPSKK